MRRWRNHTKACVGPSTVLPYLRSPLRPVANGIRRAAGQHLPLCSSGGRVGGWHCCSLFVLFLLSCSSDARFSLARVAGAGRAATIGPGPVIATGTGRGANCDIYTGHSGRRPTVLFRLPPAHF